MTRIAILAQTIATADAVGNDVSGMREALAARGHDVRIYSEGWNVTGQEVWPASEIRDFLQEPSDVVIYHHSIGWNEGVELLRELRKSKTVLKYHNVTPPEFFAGVCPDFESRCRIGREQLAGLALANYDLYLADSDFNLQELEEKGLSEDRGFVVPPFHHTDRLCSLEPDLEVLDACRDGKANILMVGRVSPNKAHAELIEAFAKYYYNYNRHSQLLIIGNEEEVFETYYESLRELISRLWLAGAVVFTGAVTDEALKAYYMTAHVFLTTSQHEGFCVPLVEAMAMKVPIVAYSSSAIPGTAGDAALVWSERNPNLVAESINMIVSDEQVSGGLGLLGWRRYQQMFSNQKIEELFISALANVL
ncbi:MAG: glycosyltransferase family 4 protein [Acidobacteriota bacterium]|nr:glycosyltransferase family 4 protein [Acidobacteriota bacterium]